MIAISIFILIIVVLYMEDIQSMSDSEDFMVDSPVLPVIDDGVSEGDPPVVEEPPVVEDELPVATKPIHPVKITINSDVIQTQIDAEIRKYTRQIEKGLIIGICLVALILICILTLIFDPQYLFIVLIIISLTLCINDGLNIDVYA